jgi:hypothetical protein
MCVPQTGLLLPPFFRFLPAQPSPPNGRHVLPPPRARVYIYMGPWQASPLWRRPKGGLVSTHKANQAKPAECVRGHTAGSRERTRASLPLLISILPSPTARSDLPARSSPCATPAAIFRPPPPPLLRPCRRRRSPPRYATRGACTLCEGEEAARAQQHGCSCCFRLRTGFAHRGKIVATTNGREAAKGTHVAWRF